MLAVVIATAVYGRHVETELRQAEADFRDVKTALQDANQRVGHVEDAKKEMETLKLQDSRMEIQALKKWDQNRMESQA